MRCCILLRVASGRCLSPLLALNLAKIMPKEIPVSNASRDLWARCEELGQAVVTSDVGQTVTAVQHLILRYYDNVREQAAESFGIRQARCTFWIRTPAPDDRICDLYRFDGASTRLGLQADTRRDVGGGKLGMLGSAIVETIAGLQFYLYGKATSNLPHSIFA